MGNQNMRTPGWLFYYLNERFGPFRLDAAANDENHLCEEYYTEKRSGLQAAWTDVTFCNPPFKESGLWVKKALWERTQGCSSVMILPIGCSQQWYRLFISKATIYLPDKRIHFDEPDGTPTSKADRDTMVVHVNTDKRDLFRWECRPLDLSGSRPEKSKLPPEGIGFDDE